MTTESKPTASDWVRLLAEELGTALPTDDEISDLLAIAGVAAHASERTAAPLTTWLLGRAGLSPAEAKEIATRLASRLDSSG
ncbi:MAG: DUF6457 domain-containing protein [Actinomycetota bacterium]|nr:DUF6457 domain-containing protein [Actinomycetota bacterium]